MTVDFRRLSPNPPRDNVARDCLLIPPEESDSDALPKHVIECTCPNHDGMCRECGFKITVGASSGIEYGHAHAPNRTDGQGPCPYRPTAVNPGARP
ncbi:hypothetical protein ACFQH6_19585 [Halobacteriaceae archaeon GCM10025711]